MSNSAYPDKGILFLSLPLAVLVIIVSSIGLFTPDFYAEETLNWKVQSVAQDAIDLFLITPFLIITAIFAGKKNKTALHLWSAANLYFIYTFTIYCFDVHFNNLFLIYCLVLGLSFYSFIYSIFLQRRETIQHNIFQTSIVKVIAIYFLFIVCIFYFLWLSEILPPIIQNITPKSLIETGLPTNPVHVIDLAILLPGLFILSVLLLKKRSLGLLFAPVALTFFILMDITIGWLAIAMKQQGLAASYVVTVFMSVLALVSLVLLILVTKRSPGIKKS